MSKIPEFRPNSINEPKVESLPSSNQDQITREDELVQNFGHDIPAEVPQELSETEAEHLSQEERARELSPQPLRVLHRPRLALVGILSLISLASLAYGIYSYSTYQKQSSQLKEQVRVQVQEMTRLNQEVANLTSQRTSLQKELESLRQNEGLSETARTQYLELKSRAEDLQLQLAAREAEISELKNQSTRNKNVKPLSVSKKTNSSSVVSSPESTTKKTSSANPINSQVIVSNEQKLQEYQQAGLNSNSPAETACFDSAKMDLLKWCQFKNVESTKVVVQSRMNSATNTTSLIYVCQNGANSPLAVFRHGPKELAVSCKNKVGSPKN